MYESHRQIPGKAQDIFGFGLQLSSESETSIKITSSAKGERSGHREQAQEMDIEIKFPSHHLHVPAAGAYVCTSNDRLHKEVETAHKISTGTVGGGEFVPYYIQTTFDGEESAEEEVVKEDVLGVGGGLGSFIVEDNFTLVWTPVRHNGRAVKVLSRL